MYCEKCGKEVKNNVNFCPICGQDMKNAKAKNEEAKQKIIKDLSVALPIYKGLSDICDEREKWLKLLEKTYKKKTYGTPGLTLLVYFVIVYIKLAISAVIVNIVLQILPVYKLLSFIFQEDILTVGLVYSVIQLGLSITLLIMFKKLKRSYYQKEIDKIQERMNEHVRQNSCPELYCMPDEYLGDYDAMKYVYDALVSNHADTLKQALNMYEKELRKNKQK